MKLQGMCTTEELIHSKEQGKELQEMRTTEKLMHSKKTSRETFLLGSNEKKHSFGNRIV
jgi:hypothetical protein